MRCVCAQAFQSCLTLQLHGCSPPDSSVLGVSPGKNAGVRFHALLQGFADIHRMVHFVHLIIESFLCSYVSGRYLFETWIHSLFAHSVMSIYIFPILLVINILILFFIFPTRQVSATTHNYIHTTHNLSTKTLPYLYINKI